MKRIKTIKACCVSLGAISICLFVSTWAPLTLPEPTLIEQILSWLPVFLPLTSLIFCLVTYFIANKQIKGKLLFSVLMLIFALVLLAAALMA